MDAALDIELINDFFGEYDDACLSIREILTELNQQPDDQEAPHALFRRMHSVKSNLRMMGLNELSEFIHHLENILDQIRNNQRDYIQLMSDLFLLSLSRVAVWLMRSCMSRPMRWKDCRNLIVRS